MEVWGLDWTSFSHLLSAASLGVLDRIILNYHSLLISDSGSDCPTANEVLLMFCFDYIVIEAVLNLIGCWDEQKALK